MPNRPYAELAAALSALDWDVRTAAIEEVAATLDLRFEARLRLIARFHVAPRAVRDAAQRAHGRLVEHRQQHGGRLSAVESRGLLSVAQVWRRARVEATSSSGSWAKSSAGPSSDSTSAS